MRPRLSDSLPPDVRERIGVRHMARLVRELRRAAGLMGRAPAALRLHPDACHGPELRGTGPHWRGRGGRVVQPSSKMKWTRNGYVGTSREIVLGRGTLERFVEMTRTRAAHRG